MSTGEKQDFVKVVSFCDTKTAVYLVGSESGFREAMEDFFIAGSDLDAMGKPKAFPAVVKLKADRVGYADDVEVIPADDFLLRFGNVETAKLQIQKPLDLQELLNSWAIHNNDS